MENAAKHGDVASPSTNTADPPAAFVLDLTQTHREIVAVCAKVLPQGGSFVPTCPAMERRPHRHFVAPFLSLLLAACGPTVVIDLDTGGGGDMPPGGSTTGLDGSESGVSSGVPAGSTGAMGSSGESSGDAGLEDSTGPAVSIGTGEPHCEPVWDPTYTWATCMCDGAEAPPEACECVLSADECWCGVNLYPPSTCCEMTNPNTTKIGCWCGGAILPPATCGCAMVGGSCICDGDLLPTEVCCDPLLPHAPGC